MFCTDTIGRDLLCGFELLDVHLGQADVADLAFLLQRDEFADLVLGGELVVDAVQLEQVDGVHAETAQAHLALLPQIGREAEDRPRVGPGAQQTGLRRDDDTVGVRVQRLADQSLGHVRAVGIRGVDEVDAEFDGAAQDANAFFGVGGRAPYTLSGQAHGAESQAVDREIAADGERSRCLSDALRGHFSDRTPAMTWCPCEVERSGCAAVDVCRSGRDGGAVARRIPPRAEVGGRSGADGSRFEEAADKGMRWGMLRGAGLRVEATSEVAAVGSEVIVHLGPVRAPCRVVYVVDEPDRRGFAYGTLPGHAESGEERFVVRYDPATDEVYAEVDGVLAARDMVEQAGLARHIGHSAGHHRPLSARAVVGSVIHGCRA